MLRESGFEVYRTSPSEVRLAERVRENLLMDSAVAVRVGEKLAVLVHVRAEAAKYPGETAEQLFERARTHAAPLLEQGFVERDARGVPIWDPGDRTQTLDTWFEICLEKPISAGFTPELEAELRRALAFDKSA